MAILISAKGVRKTFGARTLFESLNFVIEDQDRIGLIGPNGSGKSTLLNILATRIPPDAGELSFQRGLKIGFLEQSPSLPLKTTVEDAVLEGLDSHDSNVMALSGELFSKLDLVSILNTPTEKLSGGWKKRVALARELIKEPQLLLLDEPTNHLDIESILWLEEFLAKSSFAVLVITHDRLFLQRITDRILELDQRNPGGLLNVRGDYATYLDRKEELLETQKRLEVVLKNKMRRETEWLRRGPKARTTKQQARIKAAGNLQETVKALEIQNESRNARIDFQGSEKKPKRLIEAQKITKKSGERFLFRDLDLFIGPDSRIGLLGTNGCGKSTLIRILLGKETPDSGNILRSEHLKVAYFDQNRDILDPKQTLRKTLCPVGDQVDYRGKWTHIHGYLDRFLFRKEQIDMPLARLSGGEQSRVLIAQLMLKAANLLVLDEPTNDLDVETLDVLQDCLTEFSGAILLVTHDRYFLDQVVSEIYSFPTNGENTGKVLVFAGLNQWENHRQENLRGKKEAPRDTSASVTSTIKKRKLSFNEVRELSQMEEKISTLETKLKELNEDTQLPENQSNAGRLSELFQEIAHAEMEMEKLFARWTELEAVGKG